MTDSINFEHSYLMSDGILRPIAAMIPGIESQRHAVSEFQESINASYDFNVWNIKLERLRNLGESWSGYGTPPPSDAAIVTAKAFLARLIGTDFEPSRLAPSVAGGVGITHKKRGRRVYVEFFNDGEVCSLFSDGETDPRSRRVKPGYGPFQDLAREIREYLDA